ncbi:MAG: toxin-antitoxin system HicB family antitoxin [Spirochaetes bacterium]|nr:toxin-antitoxin system HicB family antitoxin [Spirochaetota bacterium]
MSKNASTLTLRIPRELKHKIEKIADKEGVSINQLAMYFFTKEVEDLSTFHFFEKYYKSKIKEKIISDAKHVLAKVKKRSKPPEWDAAE